jgi:hypothetical protein
MSMNPDVALTLDDAVGEVLNLLTGLELTYDPELDRYRAITRQLNRALRATALDNEWSWYSSILSIGSAGLGEQELLLPTAQRPRIINDDAVRLVDSKGQPFVWAYFMPRDALHKYANRAGLWCTVTVRTVLFSRPFNYNEAGLEVQLPVMREPHMFRLPEIGSEVSSTIRNQPIDFPYPDLVVARAAFMYAQTDPVMQPRAQTLEDQYKNIMYQLIERDTASTETPYMNDFRLNVQNGLVPDYENHLHPHSDY